MAIAVSPPLLDEYFDAADDRFLDELYSLKAQTKLKRWAERLAADSRPFAREARLRYIADGCDRPGHRAFLKMLFKAIEAARDDEAMGQLLVALHRPVRMRLGERQARFSMRRRMRLSRRAVRYFRAISERAARPFAPPGLSLEQSIELACRSPEAVAELGLSFARTKPICNEASVRAVAGLGRAELPRVRQEGVQWATQVIERSPHSRPEHLRDLIGSPHEDARRLAVAVMTRSLRFKDATELWAALEASPHDDTRAFLLLHLTRRKSALAVDTPLHLWASVLLKIHRDGGVKPGVVDRITDFMAAHPATAEAVRPLLGIALRPPPTARPVGR